MTAPADPVAAVDLAEAYESDARFLRGLCYRLTGDVAASDDIVQETFVRAIEHGPELRDGTLRPWLVRVATNLGRDHLRRRRRQRYVGPWLPTPVATKDEASPPSHEPVADHALGVEGRYDLLESVSFAFLLALEALTPKQRAVLLLRDVFDYTVEETGDALDLGTADVKTSHHRARRAMAAYDRARCVPTRARQEKTRAALAALGAAVTSGDTRAAEALLASSVHALSDGGGEFFAARVPLIGPERVARFYTKIGSRQIPGMVIEMGMLNGLPALLVELPTGQRGEAPRFITRLDVGADDRVVAIHSVLATPKLVAVPFRSRAGVSSGIAVLTARRPAP